MSTWRVNDQEEPPQDFLDLLFDEDGSGDDFSEGEVEEEFLELDDQDDDNEAAAERESPVAPPYSPLTSPERRRRTLSMDEDRFESYDRPRSPLGPVGLESETIPYADKITPDPILHNNANRDTKADSIRSSYNSQFKVGIYGWRKKCLYILVMALMFMMIINLALTLWVLKVLDFNSEGMGQLRIVPGGLQLLGQALVLDSLFASSIKSRRGQPISVESSRNFTVSTRDEHGVLQSRLFLGHDRLEVNAGRLEIRDSRGVLLLGAVDGGVTIGADTLTVASPAGVTLQTSAQTPLVKAPPSKPLMLESPTRSLQVYAGQNIALESRAGDISASCLTTFRLKSVAGSIRIDAPSIYMPKLKSALPLPPSQPHTHDPHHQNIYQLCACANGKLFLAPPHGVCAAREESLICR